MSAAATRQAQPRRWVAVLTLTCAGGWVDAFGYLTLGRIYAGNMSGNTVLVGVHAVAGDASAALLHAYTIATFLAGLVIAGVVIEVARSAGLRRVIALAMALEIACLIALLAGSEWTPPKTTASSANFALVGFATGAMGLQNTSLRMAGVLTFYTTHVTGALTRFSEDAVAWLLARSGYPARQERGGGVAILFSFGQWATFLLGAAGAAWALDAIGPLSLSVPIAAAIAIGVLDLMAPLMPARG